MPDHKRRVSKKKTSKIPFDIVFNAILLLVSEGDFRVMYMAVQVSKVFFLHFKDKHDVWVSLFHAWNRRYYHQTPEVPLRERLLVAGSRVVDIVRDLHGLIMVPNIHQSSGRLIEVMSTGGAEYTKWTRRFNCAMFRMFCMMYDSACHVCGSTNKVVPCWFISKVLCNTCLQAELISSEVLKVVYGITMTRYVKVAGQERKMPFIDGIRNKCYFFLESRWRLKQYSCDPVDLSLNKGVRLAFFSRTNLRKLVDLEPYKMEQIAMRNAMKKVERFMQGHRVPLMHAWSGVYKNDVQKDKKMSKVIAKMVVGKDVYTHDFPRNSNGSVMKTILNLKMQKYEKKNPL